MEAPNDHVGLYESYQLVCAFLSHSAFVHCQALSPQSGISEKTISVFLPLLLSRKCCICICRVFILLEDLQNSVFLTLTKAGVIFIASLCLVAN